MPRGQPLEPLMSRRIEGGAIVGVQIPLLLPDYSGPQPDVAVLRPREDFYAEAHPKPGDVLLLIEVSDTTLRYDREVKLPLYALAGIPEVLDRRPPGRGDPDPFSSPGRRLCGNRSSRPRRAARLVDRARPRGDRRRRSRLSDGLRRSCAEFVTQRGHKSVYGLASRRETR